MAEYLLAQGEIKKVGIGEYYGSKSGLPRADLDQGLAGLLEIVPGRQISTDELANLLQGLTTSGRPVPGASHRGPTAKSSRIAYYDLTLSAPKHLSIAIALAPSDDERAVLDRCHTDAVTRTMRYIETQAANLRMGDSGKKGIEHGGKLAWFTFEDYTARPTVLIADGDQTVPQRVAAHGDPHRHTHCILISKVLSPSGRIGSIHGRKALAGRVHEYGKIYQAFLATNLRLAGVDARLDAARTKMAHIPQVAREAVELFSKRTTDGEATARAWAAKRGRNWDELTPREKVAFLKTATAQRREAKPEGDGDTDLEMWKREAIAGGYRHGSVLCTEVRSPAPVKDRLRDAFPLAQSQLDPALERVSVFDGSIARIAAVESLIEHGIVDPGPEIFALTRAFRTEGVLQEGIETALAWGKLGDAHFSKFTTALHLDQERELIGLLSAAGADRSRALTAEQIDTAVSAVQAEAGIVLSQAQREAVEASGAGGRAALLVGVHGVGKTDAVLRPLVRAWHDRGDQTIGVTLAWRQTHGLLEAGVGTKRRRVEPNTGNLISSGVDRNYAMQAFLYGAEKGHIELGPQTVVVIDEVGKIGTRQLLRLARLQEKHKFQSFAIGDHLQTVAIDAGHAVRLYERALGKGAIPELTETVRQRRERDRETALLFRAGRAADALERKDHDDTLRIVPGGSQDAIKAAVELWEERLRANDGVPRYSLGISAPTNADARAVGAEIRQRRQARGDMGGDAVTLDAIDQIGAQYELKIAVGDRLRLFNRVHGAHATEWRGTQRVRPARVGENGSVVEVVSIQTDTLTVRTAKDKIASVAWAQFNDKETGRIRLTYGDCLTIDSRQGDTLSEHITVMPAGSQAVTGFKAYTAESRHRERSWIITSQGEEMAEIEARRPLGDPRNQITAREAVKAAIMENMARNLSRQDEKQLATDFVEQARDVRHGTVGAGRAAWHRPESPRPASTPLRGQQPNPRPDHGAWWHRREQEARQHQPPPALPSDEALIRQVDAGTLPYIAALETAVDKERVALETQVRQAVGGLGTALVAAGHGASYRDLKAACEAEEPLAGLRDLAARFSAAGEAGYRDAVVNIMRDWQRLIDPAEVWVTERATVRLDEARTRAQSRQVEMER